MGVSILKLLSEYTVQQQQVYPAATLVNPSTREYNTHIYTYSILLGIDITRMKKIFLRSKALNVGCYYLGIASFFFFIEGDMRIIPISRYTLFIIPYYSWECAPTRCSLRHLRITMTG